MRWLTGVASVFGLSPSASASSYSDQSETRHRGASRTLRSMASWWARRGDAAADASAYERGTLRDRCRDAYRNQGIARAVVNRGRNSIVGTGLMANPDVDADALGLTKEEAKAYNIRLRRNYLLWADNPLECDIEGTEDVYGLQAMTLVSSMVSGDVLVSTPMVSRGGVYDLKCQLIEADRVSNPAGKINSASLVDGVALASGGMPVGYHVDKHHPGSNEYTGPDHAYLAAFDQSGRRRVMLVHDDRDRPGTVRGVPYLAPILEPLRKIGKLTQAELTAAVVSSMMTVFIEKDAERLGANDVPLGPTGEPIEDEAPQDIEMGEGSILDLAPGEKANMAHPVRPNAQFAPFFNAICEQIGAALNVPKSEILLVYEQSYTAARAAMLQAWRFFTMRRWRLVVHFCQPMYALQLDEQVARGMITLPGYSDPIKRRAWQRCIWNGPARGAMDELKEAQAAEKRIQIGVSNEAIEAMQMTGEDRDSIHAQRVVEVDERKADGTYAEQFPKALETAAAEVTTDE